ncbi:hypothetical protein ACFWMJ_23555 [Streptomyces hawaiiensis]|uniref:hypothetical protein n=1 Tax=Streptomyces hawaiiensis TaxID=67305 RepID=UPI003667381A
MAEQCGAEIPDDDAEYNRDERIETLYQGWGAREMAERIVELEDELGEEKDGICTGMHADVAEAHAEIERLRAERDEYRDELSKVADFDEWELSAWGETAPIRTFVTDVRPHAAQERDRYRLAWISARQRAADEANFGMEALELKEQELRRLRAELAELRQTFDAPRLEPLDDGEGGQVWRLVGSTSDGADVYATVAGTPLRQVPESPASHSDASAP